MANQQKNTGEAANKGNLASEVHKLHASTEEEVDALKLDLTQEEEQPSDRDGSGHVVDDLAVEKMAKFTEVGPMSGERGAESVVPGRDNTSCSLLKHHPNTEIARAEDVVEGNLDEPVDELKIEPKVDEGTAA